MRDLATWTMNAAAAGFAGIYNITGPAVSFDEFLATCPTTTDIDTTVLWVSESQLLTAGVSPATGAAMWISAPPTGEIAVAKAHAAGLRPRPIAHTLRDILDWDTARGGVATGHAGLPPHQEEALLSLLSSSSA